MRGLPRALPVATLLAAGTFGAGMLASAAAFAAPQPPGPAPGEPSRDLEGSELPDEPALEPARRPADSPAGARARGEPPATDPAGTLDAAQPSRTSDRLTPTPAEWSHKYEEARTKLLTGEFTAAAALFAELEATAVNRVDLALARAHRSLADDWSGRNLTFVRRQDLADPALASRALDRRSTDELVSLYTNAVLYGVGSAIWLGALTEPKTAAGAILPGVALTAGAVGTVLALDSGRGLRYGVPQSIVSGMWVGLEHGIVWTLWHNSRANTPGLETTTHATILWGLSTVGAVAGGVLGETLGTTPGRSAWVGSTALWTGALAGFATGGVVRDGATPALALAGIGLSAGTGIGLLSAEAVSPSIGRVRLIDLSGLLGGVASAALYTAAANRDSTAQATSGFTALGIAGGLAIGWIATSGMAKDTLRTREPADEKAPSARRAGDALASRVTPLLLPSQSGAMIGAGGTF
ncbi:MAG: hypothetical protein KF894_33105 [Labilithrix sp.]|nr:hypothetical protein [Labilithrix sp.]